MRAWLDVLAESKKATEEVPIDEDLRRASVLRDAVVRETAKDNPR